MHKKNTQISSSKKTDERPSQTPGKEPSQTKVYLISKKSKAPMYEGTRKFTTTQYVCLNAP